MIFIVGGLRRLVSVENTEAIVANRVSNIVAEFTELALGWPNARVE